MPMITLLYIVSCIYFFLPAYIANASPPLANTFNLFNRLNKPIDGGKTIKGVPVLGSHKTWRGLIFEIVICFLLFQLIFWINNYYNLPFLSVVGINSSTVSSMQLGLLLGIGIVFGDLLFAFIKRRLQLRPGTAFVPFDQTNYVIGAFIFIQPLLGLSFNFWITLFVLTFFIHILFNRIGYNLGLHKARW
jgi:CDP-2,3-bis-(O-geranylgeranyl)-sn-glycerol synthase